MANGPLPFDSTTKPKVYLEADWNEMCKHGFEKTAAYIVRVNDSYYEAIKGGSDTLAGTIVYGGSGDEGGATGTVAEEVITAAITGAAGGRVHIKGADYTLTGDIVVGQSGTVVTGDGVDTKLTQSIADENVFSITTKTDVTLADMYLYGTGSGTGCGVDVTTTATDLTLLRLKVENHGGHGVQVINSDYPKILGCNIVSNILSGLVFDRVDYGKILGCKINTNTQNGIIIGDSSYNLVSGNHIIGNDSADSASYDGVRLLHSAATSDYNRITNNVLDNNDKYEINILTSSCTGNVVYPNTFNPAGDHEGILQDDGTSTIMGRFIIPFSDAGGGATLNAAGYGLDANGEFATSWFMIPSDVHEIKKALIYAQSGVLEADKMRLQFTVYGGADNEAATTHNGSVADHPSTSSNFAVSDIIYWTLTEAGFLALTKGDSARITINHEAAGGDDCETDAFFRSVTVYYV